MSQQQSAVNQLITGIGSVIAVGLIWYFFFRPGAGVPTGTPMPWNEAVAQARTISYDSLIRQNEQYIGQLVRFPQARVTSVDDNGHPESLHVRPGDLLWSDGVWVNGCFCGRQRYGDILDIVGRVTGLMSDLTEPLPVITIVSVADLSAIPTAEPAAAGPPSRTNPPDSRPTPVDASPEGYLDVFCPAVVAYVGVRGPFDDLADAAIAFDRRATREAADRLLRVTAGIRSKVELVPDWSRLNRFRDSMVDVVDALDVLAERSKRWAKRPNDANLERISDGLDDVNAAIDGQLAAQYSTPELTGLCPGWAPPF